MFEICLSLMNPTILEILKEILIIGLLPEVTDKTNFTPLTYSPVKLLFDGFVPRTNDQNECERDAHFPSNLQTVDL